MTTKPEATGATRLRQIAHRMQALSAGAWSEAEDGTLRVDLRSPQFGLLGFYDSLIELAGREGYAVSTGGPEIDVFRDGWKKSRKFLILTPRARVETGNERA